MLAGRRCDNLYDSQLQKSRHPNIRRLRRCDATTSATAKYQLAFVGSNWYTINMEEKDYETYLDEMIESDDFDLDEEDLDLRNVQMDEETRRSLRETSTKAKVRR